MTRPKTGRPTLEFTVLLAFRPDEVTSLAELAGRLPTANRGSIASAVTHLLAERSLRRVKPGVYCLTDQGRAKQIESV